MKQPLRRSVRSVTQLMSAETLSKLIAAGVLAFYARVLDKELLALLPIYELLGGLGAVMLGFGLLPNLVRVLPSLLETDEPEARALARAGLRVIGIGAFVFAGAVFLAAEPLAKLLAGGVEATVYVQIMALGFIAFFLRRAAVFMLWASSRFDGMSVVTATYSVGNLVAVALLYWGDLRLWVFGFFVRDALSALVALPFLRGLLFGARARGPRTRALMRESLPFYFEAYLTYLRGQGDQWIVGTYLGPTAMAVYYVAKRLYGLLTSFFEAIDRVLTANVLRRRTQLDGLPEQLGRVFLVLSQTAFPLIFLAIGLTPLFVRVVAGPDFEEAVVPSILLCLVILSQFARQPLASTIFAVRSPRERLKLTAMESACLLPLIFLLAPLFAETGVALGRLISSVLAWVYAWYSLRRVLTVPVPWRKAGASLVLSASMAAALLVLQAHDPKLLHVPLQLAACGIGFLLLNSLFNSEGFYGTWNSILPFRVFDPVRALLRRPRSQS